MSGESGLIIGLVIGAVVFIIVGIIACVRRNRRVHGAVLSAPVVVTTTAHTNPGGYPVSVEPTPGGGYQATPYPNAMPMPGYAPYPTHQGGMPMPQVAAGYVPPPAAGFQPNVAPYPPAVVPPHQAPPSYDQVVGTESYGKQSPYNPNYTN